MVSIVKACLQRENIDSILECSKTGHLIAVMRESQAADRFEEKSFVEPASYQDTKFLIYREDKFMKINDRNPLLAAVMVSIGTMVAASVGLTSLASAQTPNRIKQHKDWGAYSHQSASGKICYILSVPVKKEPQERDHGDVFFMLSQHPGQNGVLEPQFTVGYPFKDQSKVALVIDGKTFTMFTVGSNAWMENRAEEQQVIDAMRAGRDMSLSGFSRRGTNTVYTYSLSGVTASLNEIKSCSGS